MIVRLLWERVKQSELTVSSVKTGSLSFDDLSDEDSSSEGLSDDILDFTVKFELKDCSDEVFAYLFRYVTADSGQLSVEDLVDFQFVDYPNFHDESMTMLNMMEVKAKEKRCGMPDFCLEIRGKSKYAVRFGIA